MENVWCAVRAHLTCTEPTVSFRSLVNIYDAFHTEPVREDALEVMESVYKHCRRFGALPKGSTPDIVIFSIFYWTCSLFKASDLLLVYMLFIDIEIYQNSKQEPWVDLEVLIDDYDVKKAVLCQAIATLKEKYCKVADAVAVAQGKSLASVTPSSIDGSCCSLRLQCDTSYTQTWY